MINKFFFFMLLYFLSFNLWANVGVSPIIVDLIGKEADAEIAVKNFDLQNNAYVEITPYRLLNPADHRAPKKRVQRPDQEGLLVFPAKLVLLPGQTQFVRIINTAKSLSSDQVYEVDFIPKVSSHLISQKRGDLLLGIRVIVGYGARVIVRPDFPRPSLSVKRNKNILIIKNTGNTAIKITSCTQKNGNNQPMEIPLSAYTLFVGQTITKNLTQLTPVTLNMSSMGKLLGPVYTD